MAKDSGAHWGFRTWKDASITAREPYLRLGAAMLKDAVVQARDEGDPNSWLYLESPEAELICELLGFDTNAIPKFIENEWPGKRPKDEVKGNGK